jgi:S-adenosylmethionine synthetase
MNNERHLFTSESVTEGHPDKVSDNISDAVLDAIMENDPNGRVACETMVTTGLALIAGEITTSCYVDIPKIARQTIKDIGYTDATYGFDYETCAVLTSIDEQSPDISQGVTVTEDHEQGAGDQGMMFGYACNQTDELMPLPILLAHKLTKRLAEVRKEGIVDFLRPDGKSQVTVEYESGRPVRVDAVVIATQHHDHVNGRELSLADVQEAVRAEVIDKVIPAELVDANNYKCIVNGTGRFVVGGPQGDCGLTGRKIIVDTYGGVGSHGGGAFSGKDPSKVDRSGAYMARYVAKNIVAAGLATECELQLAYAIGVADPVSVMIDTNGTSEIGDAKLSQIVREIFPLKPAAMIKHLDLRKPIFKKTAAYGHFGREDQGFRWEETDKVDELRSAAQ